MCSKFTQFSELSEWSKSVDESSKKISSSATYFREGQIGLLGFIIIKAVDCGLLVVGIH